MAFNPPNGATSAAGAASTAGAINGISQDDFFNFYIAKHEQDLDVLAALEFGLATCVKSEIAVMGVAYANVARYQVQQAINNLNHEKGLLERHDMSMMDNYLITAEEINELNAWKRLQIFNGKAKERLPFLKMHGVLQMVPTECEHLMAQREASGKAFVTGPNGTIIGSNVNIPDGMEYLKYMFAYRIGMAEYEKTIFDGIVKSINGQFGDDVAQGRFSFSVHATKALFYARSLAANRLQTLNTDLANYKAHVEASVVDFDINDWNKMFKMYEDKLLQPHSAEAQLGHKRSFSGFNDQTGYGADFAEEQEQQQEESQEASRVQRMRSDANLKDGAQETPDSQQSQSALSVAPLMASVPAFEPQAFNDTQFFGGQNDLPASDPAGFMDAQNGNAQQADAIPSDMLPQSMDDGLPVFEPNRSFFGNGQQVSYDSPPQTDPASQT